MRRILAFVAGLGSAAVLSQFPEFSQQYLQRLGGQAEALQKVVAEFDISATRALLTREEALKELDGSRFLTQHQVDMRAVIARSEKASADYALLQAAGPLERLALPHRFRDSETLQATWKDFRPALPLTVEGAASAGVGFGLGWATLALLSGLFLRPFRKTPAPEV